MDWKTQFINNIKLTVMNNNQDSISKIKEFANKHTDANYFLKIHPPSALKDFAVFVNKDNETHVFSFDFANIGDYCTYNGCKPKTVNGQSWQT